MNVRKLLVCLAVLVWVQVQADTADDVSFEILDDSGRKEALIRGSGASFLDSGIVVIKDVDSDIYQDEEVMTKFYSSECYYDRINNMVTSETDVRIVNPEIEVDATGMKWDPGEEVFEVYKDVKTTIKSDHLF